MTSQNKSVLAMGVDVARGGWVAALWLGRSGPKPLGSETRLLFADSLDQILACRGDSLPPVAIDIPIGVKKWGGDRECDRQARQRLPGISSTVFPPPGRFLFAAVGDYKRVRAEVERKQRELGFEKVSGVSAQSAALLPRVVEVENYLKSRTGRAEFPPTRPPSMFEVHPELSFRAIAGAPIARKNSAHGVLARLELVKRVFPDSAHAIRDWPEGDRASLIDALDAYAALWTARRMALGEPLEVLGAGSKHGGLPAEIRV